MKKSILVSIIIPCREIDFLTQKCINKCLELDYDNFKILVFPDDSEIKFKDKRVKIIKTGNVNVRPSFKRNEGMRIAKGEFFAFIDSDAYPIKDWLKNALKYFKNEKVGIVGGPNLTPSEGNFWEKISGYSLSNFFVSGKAAIRYKISRSQYTHELPSCNYIARKEASSEYDHNFLTAEDSEFCFNCKKKGYKILYAGDVIVYHHRRKTFWKNIKQVFVYSRDIAWLTKKDFSLDKLYYPILSLFVIGFLEGIISSFFSYTIKEFFIIFLFFYLLIMLVTSINKNIKTSFFVFISSILTHFSYGFGWLYGIFAKQKSEQFSER